jgi:hypothetical protein
MIGFSQRYYTPMVNRENCYKYNVTERPEGSFATMQQPAEMDINEE